MGYSFQNKDLLIEAITHSSAAREINNQRGLIEQKIRWNERLEFLGDSVLGLSISDKLMRKEKECQEGELSKLRAHLVSALSLVEIAESIRLGDFLILSVGESKAGGSAKHSLLADALEACFGAIYLDGGFEKTKSVILSLFKEKLEYGLTEILEKDYKTRLQELTQELYKQAPEYRLVEKKGPDHKAQFLIALHIKEHPVFHGTGCSKKSASQNAAKKALQKLLESARS